MGRAKKEAEKTKKSNLVPFASISPVGIDYCTVPLWNYSGRWTVGGKGGPRPTVVFKANEIATSASCQSENRETWPS